MLETYGLLSMHSPQGQTRTDRIGLLDVGLQNREQFLSRSSTRAGNTLSRFEHVVEDMLANDLGH